MKKLFIVIALIAITSSIAKAQTKDTTKVFTGFMFAPQGGLAFNAPKQAFSTFYPLYAIVAINKGSNTITPLYSLTVNLVGVAFQHNFTPNLGMYGIVNKSLLNNHAYTGVGLARPVASGRASAFVELGQLYGTGHTGYFFTGVFIPLTWRVK